MSFPKFNIEWERINLGTIVQVVLILGMMYAGWLKMGTRQDNFETVQKEQQVQINKLTALEEKENLILDRMQIQLETFPLHRHLSNNDILYPGAADVGHQAR